MREMNLPVKTARGGALSPIRNQRLLQEVASSVKIRVFDLTYGDIVQQVETKDFNVFATNVDYDFRRECLRGNS